MARWTLTSLKHIPTSTTLAVGATTNILGHLWLSWSYTRPDATPIYRTVRGRMVFCGYRYIWDTPTLVEQIQFGDTMAHNWVLKGLTPNSTIWYYLHSPQPPSPWECQGPLQMVKLLHVGPPGKHLYFASRSLGMFATSTYTADPAQQPIWYTDNQGLLSLSIRHAAQDPFIPQWRRYVIAGPHLYQMHSLTAFATAMATVILSWPQAIALTGSPDGSLLWVTPNPQHPGWLHVLWQAQFGSNGFWHLRTLDYGGHWTAHQITADPFNWTVGNIQVGRDRGASPYPAGDVLYVPLNIHTWGDPHVARSLDQGATWQDFSAPGNISRDHRRRLYVDPANQATVYLGDHPSYYRLWRSLDHAQSWARVDQGLPISIDLRYEVPHGELWSHYSDPSFIRSLHTTIIRRSDDYAATWTTPGATDIPVRTFAMTDLNPNFIHLAMIRNAGLPPLPEAAHVLFFTTNEGATWHPRAGPHPEVGAGGADSIPYTCGGAADDGIIVPE